MKLRDELLMWFLVLSIGTLVVALSGFFWYYSFVNKRQSIDEKVVRLEALLLNKQISSKDFLLSEVVNPSFYSTGFSDVLNKKGTVDKEILLLLDELESICTASSLCQNAAELKQVVCQSDSLFNSLIKVIWKRGYKDYGIVGLMRQNAHKLEVIPQVDQRLLLNLRRREKDFIIRHEQVYVTYFDEIAQELLQNVQKETRDDIVKDEIVNLLNGYIHYFHEIVKMDYHTGMYNHTGTIGEIQELESFRFTRVQALKADLELWCYESMFKVKLLFIVTFLLVVIVCILLSVFLSKKVTKPISDLTKHIENICRENILEVPHLPTKHFSNEVSLLYSRFKSLIKEIVLHEKQNENLVYQLSESEQKYRTMAERLPQSIFETDSLGHVVYANKKWCKTFGYSQNDLRKGVLIHDLISNKKQVENHLSEGLEVIARCKDGSWFAGLLYTDNIYNDDSVIGQRGLIIDITERYRYVKLLKNERKKALEADQLKSSFLATISHEVRTPLNSIIGFTAILKGLKRFDADSEVYLSHITSSANYLLNVFNDIVDFSRIQTQSLKLSKQVLNTIKLQKDIQRLAVEMKNKNAKKGVELELDLSYLNINVVGDEDKILTVFRHLLDNAFKFTEHGNVRIKNHISGNHLIFCVADTGCGIPEEQKETIFFPFRQVDEGWDRQFQGMGMGLALCKGLLDIMDGQLWLYSIYGGGSCFCFSIPLFKELDQEVEKKSISSHLVMC